MNARPIFSWKRALAVARKEVFHVLRDPFTLAMALLIPIIMVCIFGFAIEFNLKNIPLAVHDADKTPSSRQLTRTFFSSRYFAPFVVDDLSQARQLLEREEVRASLIINHSFEKDFRSGRSTSVQLILDGADNFNVTSILGYTGQIRAMVENSSLNLPRKMTEGMIKTRYLFNPDLNTQWFIVPGLCVVVMAILSILLTALTVAREWENGSMELLLSTPITPIEIIIGKLLPYTVIGLGAELFIYLIARAVFHLPFLGNHLVFLLGCVLFLATYLAQGLLISVVMRRQQLSMQVSMVTGLLPSMLLSGFIFPVENMPTFFKVLTAILPARWFMEISRGSFLRGATFYQLRTHFGALTLICFFMIFIAVKKFKKDLEP